MRKYDNYPVPALTLQEAVKQYLLYKNRLVQLRRETMIANRMVREAQDEIERLTDVVSETLLWDCHD